MSADSAELDAAALRERLKLVQKMLMKQGKATAADYANFFPQQNSPAAAARSDEATAENRNLVPKRTQKVMQAASARGVRGQWKRQGAQRKAFYDDKAPPGKKRDTGKLRRLAKEINQYLLPLLGLSHFSLDAWFEVSVESGRKGMGIQPNATHLSPVFFF